MLLLVDKSEIRKRKIAETQANEMYENNEKKKNFDDLSTDKQTIINRRNRPGSNVSEFKEDVGLINEPKTPFNATSALSKPTDTNNSDEDYKSYLEPSQNLFFSNYFISFYIFYDPNYSRFIRCLTLFVSLSLQCMIFGFEVYQLSNYLSIPKTADFTNAFKYFNTFAICSLMVVPIFTNLIIHLLENLMRDDFVIRRIGENRINFKIKNRIFGILGIIICLWSIGSILFVSIFIANNVSSSLSSVWMYLAVFALVFDFVVVQTGKIIFRLFRNRKSFQVLDVPRND